MSFGDSLSLVILVIIVAVVVRSVRKRKQASAQLSMFDRLIANWIEFFTSGEFFKKPFTIAPLWAHRKAKEELKKESVIKDFFPADEDEEDEQATPKTEQKTTETNP